MEKQHGFTLVEIAIVLVIIGLLLGGILRGQELIQGARVRNIIDQQNGIRAAFFGFQDRFRAIPGDLTTAQVTQIGNGVVLATNLAGDGTIADTDSTTAFQNLTTTGFISCSVCTASGVLADASNHPTNVYGGVLQMVTNGAYANAAVPTGPTGPVRLNVKTGNLIPSNVMSEIDLKADDGKPGSGNTRASLWAPAGSAALVLANCATVVAPPGVSAYNTGQAGAPGGAIGPNCGGATLF